MAQATLNTRRRLFGLLMAPVAAVALLAAPQSPVLAATSQDTTAAASSTPQDWPMFLHDQQRSGASGESLISTSNVGTLKQRLAFATGGSITDSPAIVNGVAYVGSWDGYEYAFCAITSCSVGGTTYTAGQQIWKTSLGQTNDPNCTYPVVAGITSAAAVVNGVVYVGGGDSNWYALNATTGAVQWSVPTGDNSPAGGHYNWSSPVIYTVPSGFPNAGTTYAYIGIASNCDNPLVQGELLQVNLSTQQVTNVAKFVPDGQIGGGVWTSPTIDPATNTVFVSTGTINMYTQQYSQAVVSMDASTLQIKDHWQLPFEVETYDSDWGTTPTLTATLSNGHRALSAANKNGILYTFDSQNLAAGPIWQSRLALGGACPTCGQGTISSGAYAPSVTIGSYTGPVLFYAAGGTEVNGTGYQGSVTAFNPLTGAVLWTHYTQTAVDGALAYDNGVVFDDQLSTAEALDATTGNAIWDWNVSGTTYTAPAISQGELFVGDTNDNEYVFSLNTPTSPPADANCPTGFTCQDMGQTSVAGSETVSNGTWTVTAGGAGVRSSPNGMRLLTEPQTGDFQVAVTVQSITGGCNVGPSSNPYSPGCIDAGGNQENYWGPQVGIMVRQSADPAAPFYTALQGPEYPAENEYQPNLIIYYRQYWNGPVTELDQEYPAQFPRSFVVQRRGDIFQTLVASNTSGTPNYFLVPGTTKTVVMPTTLMAGMAVSSGAPSTSVTATLSNVSFGAPTNSYGYLAPQTACPTSWSCFNVNNANPPGNQSLSNGTFTVDGTGYGIASGSATFYGHEDQFYYVYQNVSGDETISAHFDGFASGNCPHTACPNAEAGLMMRASTDPRAPYYGIFFYPGSGGAIVQWRDTPNINNTAAYIPMTSTTSPLWLQISRYTDPNSGLTYYSASTSTDGSTWNPVDGSTAAINMSADGGSSSSTLMGIAVDAGATPNQQVAANFDTVTIAATSGPPAGVCDNGWTCADVGNSHVAGNQDYEQPTWTMFASGDLNDVYDQFRWAYQPWSGDGTVTARVVSQSNGGAWQKSGVMFRAGATDPQAPYYGVFVTPSNGIVAQWRTAEAATTNSVQTTVSGTAAPVYVMVAQYTDTAHNNTVYYYGQWSTDNVHWTLIPNSVVALTLPAPLYAGIVGTSYSPNLATSVFDNVNFLSSAPAPPGICPAAWNCADIGGATPPGTQVQNSDSSWTLTGSGSDIWGTSDQFHFMYESLAADGSVSASVTGENNGGAWAKGGVMMRTSTDPAAPYYGVFLTPQNGMVVQWRTSSGGNSSQIQLGGTTPTYPTYMRVTRWTDSSGSTPITYYEAFTSSDGSTWTAVPGSLMTNAGLTGSLLAGPAIDSYNNGTAATWTLGTLSVTSGETPLPGVCPSAWTCEDIGGGAPTGSQTQGSDTTSWTVQGGGSDIWNTSDQFHFVGQTLAGDGTISVRVASQSNTNAWAKAGIMLRASANDPDPQAPNYAVLVTPSNGIQVQYRSTEGGQTAGIAATSSVTLPEYLRIARWTDTSGSSPVTYYTAYTSPDGSTWTAVPGSTQVISALSGTLLDGMAVTSHSVGALSSVAFDHLTMNATEVAPPGVCPSARVCVDIGTPAPAGTQTLSGSTWSVSGGGADIWGTADQFRFVGTAETSDGTISAAVSSQTNTNAWAKAGVMMRADTTTTGAPYYAVLATPGNNTVVQWRTASGGSSSQIQLGTTPAYIEVSRYTTGGATYYTAYTSSDGSTWTAVSGSTVALSLPSTYYSGVAVTSHSVGTLSTAVFNSVTYGTTSSQPPGLCPSGDTCTDIGGAAPAGSQTVSGSSWTVSGGGSDIWGTSDQLHYAAAPETADGTISASLTSQTNTNAWAKAGVMMRADTTTAGAPYYAVLVTPGNNTVVQWRTSSGGSSSQIQLGTNPKYIEVARYTSGSTTYYTAYTSSDNSTWTAVSGSTVALSLPSTYYSGIAVTSHNNGTASTATFSNVTYGTSSTIPPGVCPAAYTCSDIGSPTPAGTQSVSGSTWTVSAGGSDIWGTTDQFRAISQALSGDGTIETRLVSIQTSGSPNGWAKAGLMLRSSSAANSAYYAVYLTPSNGLVIQYRSATGASATMLYQDTTKSSSSLPLYLKITRTSGTVAASISTDNSAWTQLNSTTFPTGAALGCLAVTSHNTSSLWTATFDTVTL